MEEIRKRIVKISKIIQLMTTMHYDLVNNANLLPIDLASTMHDIGKLMIADVYDALTSKRS